MLLNALIGTPVETKQNNKAKVLFLSVGFPSFWAPASPVASHLWVQGWGGGAFRWEA